MLHSRIRLLKDYLTSLPPSYLTSPPPANTTTIIPNNDDENTNESTPQPASPPTSQSQLSHPLLRSILALLSRLPLLFAPSAQDTLAEKSDVELVSLLGALGRSAKEVREVGRKFGVVEAARAVGRKDGWGGGGDFGGSNGGGEFDVEGGYGEYVF